MKETQQKIRQIQSEMIQRRSQASYSTLSTIPEYRLKPYDSAKRRNRELDTQYSIRSKGTPLKLMPIGQPKSSIQEIDTQKLKTINEAYSQYRSSSTEPPEPPKKQHYYGSSSNRLIKPVNLNKLRQEVNLQRADLDFLEKVNKVEQRRSERSQ